MLKPGLDPLVRALLLGYLLGFTAGVLACYLVGLA
jgi:hypothetical protein